MLFPHYIFTVDQIKYNHLQLTNMYVGECWSSISTSEIHKSYGIGLLCPAHDFIALSSSMINWIVDPDTAAEIPFIGCGNTLVLQKVPSEDDPKVRNHREGPY